MRRQDETYGTAVLARVRARMLLLALLVAGCAAPPADRFYTVSVGADEGGAHDGAAIRTIVVAPVTLPPLIDRPQLVLRTGAHEIVLLEHDRWAQPLADDLTRALVADLRHAVPGAAFISADAPQAGSAGQVLEVQIADLVCGPGPITALRASWILRERTHEVLSQGHVEKDVPAPGGRDAIASAYAAAIVSLADAISAAIR